MIERRMTQVRGCYSGLGGWGGPEEGGSWELRAEEEKELGGTCQGTKSFVGLGRVI